MRLSGTWKHRSMLMIGIAGLAYHGACGAAISFGTMDGELFLNVVNTTVNASATFDLGVPTFASNPSLAVDPTITTFGLSALSQPGVKLTWDLSGTEAWSSFANESGAALNQSKFDIKALGPSDPDNNLEVVFLTTISKGNPRFQSFALLQGFAVVGDTFVAATNGESTHSDSIEGNGANFITNDPSLYHELAVGDSWSNQLIGGNGNSSSMGPIEPEPIDPENGGLAFYRLSGTSANSSTDRTDAPPYAGVWKLTQAGLLSYTTAPVPEPASGLMLAAGLAALGALARRRLRRSEGQTWH